MKEEEKDNGEKGSSAFKEIIGAIKKYGLALLGIRSTFMIFRRAVSTAMQNNAELANKMNAIWTGLGNAITPIVEVMVNAILKAFVYLNTFIKALSGGRVDLLANTSASAKSTAGSLKEANKYLAGFDELNNVDEQNGGSGGGAGGITDAFKDIDIDTTWADKITQFGNWAKENWPLVVGLLAGTALALSPLTDEFTIWQNIGVVALCVGIGEGIKGFSDLIDGIKTKNLDLVSDGLKEIAIAVGIVAIAIKLLTGSFDLLLAGAIIVVTGIVTFVVKHWDEIKYAVNECWKSIKENFNAMIDRLKEGVTAVKEWFAEKWDNIKYAVSECWTSIKNNWEALKQKLSDGVNNLKNWFIEKWTNIKSKWDEIKNGMIDGWETFKQKIKNGVDAIVGFWDGIKQGAKDMANNVIASIEGMINKAVSGINSLIRGINKIHFSVPDWVPLIGGKYFGFNIGQLNSVTLPRLDTGTNYVPSDQLAMIHKGEAVVPKKFNSGEFFGGNDELVDKLDVLIDVVNNLDINPYITVKDVGEASVKYQNQQYRLRGRSLVNG